MEQKRSACDAKGATHGHRITRRDALRLAAGAMAVGAAPNTLMEANTSSLRPQTRNPKKVIIAGGGIAGLCCGYELMKRGHEVTVLEASGRSGGHVRTIRDPLADGFYFDAGAEHFTKPGYDLYWDYVKEFNLTALYYPRRENMLRFIDDKLYTEDELHDRKVLSSLGFNGPECEYLAQQPWWNLASLYYEPYIGRFKDEYKPFEAGLNDLDQTTWTDVLKKAGASAAAVRHIGGDGSALHAIWHAALLHLRGVPLAPPKVYRLKDGNSGMTDAFTSRLGARVRLGCPVTAIEHGLSGVTVHFREHGENKKADADFLVCCMSLVMLRQVPVEPAWPETRHYVIQNYRYYTASRPVFQSRTRFWERDAVSPNVEAGDPALNHYWRMGEDVETDRGLLVSTAQGLTTPEEALAAFHKYYPGKSQDIEQVYVHDWASDPWASACEGLSYEPGELKRFWPLIIEPHGRIHFAGAYADNLNWGMEAATRSANRVATEIDKA
jgi:monoamine oxidase